MTAHRTPSPDELPLFVNPWGGDFVHTAALMGLIHYTLGDPEIRAAYADSTGDRFSPPVSAIEAMIDEATGATRAWLGRFCTWVAAELYGTPKDLTATETEGSPA